MIFSCTENISIPLTLALNSHKVIAYLFGRSHCYENERLFIKGPSGPELNGCSIACEHGVTVDRAIGLDPIV